MSSHQPSNSSTDDIDQRDVQAQLDSQLGVPPTVTDGSPEPDQRQLDAQLGITRDGPPRPSTCDGPDCGSRR
ncbi:uncharacterized protein I206_106678 [Kwoniella pini CBS 10737]|uniref:Uncharacterized protein n=1 Tax=Kwoniella pini CBS 10737 TaxID=1296096 RepID=A0AAJ8L8M0_9TREE